MAARRARAEPESAPRRPPPLSSSHSGEGSDWALRPLGSIPGLAPAPHRVAPPQPHSTLDPGNACVAGADPSPVSPALQNEKGSRLGPFSVLAGLTGLEPATSSVTGWHSNRLSYNPLCSPASWWAMTGSNRRHAACKAAALPTELIARIAEPRSSHSDPGGSRPNLGVEGIGLFW